MFESHQHIRLQPRQLYEMIMAYRYQYPMCTDEDCLDQFGTYKDRESIKCAVKDFKMLLERNHETIEIISGPIKQKAENESYTPYLHDICTHNECYSKVLGLDKIIGNITFSSILRAPQEAFQQHINLIFEAAANDEAAGYDINDLSRIKKLNLINMMNRINTGKD